MELTLVEKLKAFAMAEARHGIGRERKDLFNEAADALAELRLQIEQRDYPCSPHCEGYLRERAMKERAEAAEKRVAELEALRDNQQFLMEWIENHFPQVMDEAEHALAEWDGKP